ncbi:MAG: lipopolysaccharide biosynthesis protein [Lachnospiraceae bacterium]|nr:lipopolysaccharide biosynthesis protein [Lachnospiraceae bacterium]
MKIERTKNATRNVFFDGMLQMMNMIVPFIMRSILLHYLGVEYLGLNGLFRSVLSFLNLAELGVGSAMVFSMYKPIAEDDSDMICALMKLYRTLYRIIGTVVLTIGLALVPFLPSLIKEEPPADINLYILYFMSLGCSVLSYWLFAYKNCLLSAHQRGDVTSKVTMGVKFCEYAFKILSLVLFQNYYMYLATQIFTQIATNILIAVRVQKMYPLYGPRGNLPKDKTVEIFKRVRDLFTSKFAFVISNSADTLVISSVLGLTVLAHYQNYYYIIESLRMMINVVVIACVAGIGNSLIVESMEKNYRDLCKMTALFAWLMSVTTPMLLCMYQPFMEIWMGSDHVLGMNYIYCFVLYYYSIGMNRMINMFKDAAGIWKIDKWRPLTAALVNLALNLATVHWLGLYGVLLSTVISIVAVETPWVIRNLFCTVFPKEHLWQYVRRYIGYIGVAFICCVTSYLACSVFHFGVWPSLFINATISFVIPNLIFLALYGRNTIFREGVSQVSKSIFKKVKK